MQMDVRGHDWTKKLPWAHINLLLYQLDTKWTSSVDDVHGRPWKPQNTPWVYVSTDDMSTAIQGHLCTRSRTCLSTVSVEEQTGKSVDVPVDMPVDAAMDCPFLSAWMSKTVLRSWYLIQILILICPGLFLVVCF